MLVASDATGGLLCSPCLALAASATAAAVAAPAAARTLTAAAWGQAACVKAIAFSLCLGL